MESVDVLSFSSWIASAGFTAFERVTVERLILGIFAPSQAGNGDQNNRTLSPEEPEDVLVPAFDARSRKSGLFISTVTLVASMVGTSAFWSVPVVFVEFGIARATMLLLGYAALKNRSLLLLCLCARSAGAASYGEAGFISCGVWMQRFISVVVGVCLSVVVLAQMGVLCQLLEQCLLSISTHKDTTTTTTTTLLPQWIQVAIVTTVVALVYALNAPRSLDLSRNLRKWRFHAVITVMGILLVTGGVCSLAIQAVLQQNTLSSPSFVPTNDEDYMRHAKEEESNFTNHSASFGSTLQHSISILSANFLSAFMVLPVQGNLKRPTQQRVHFLVHGSTVVSFLFLYCIGIAGYCLLQSEVYTSPSNSQTTNLLLSSLNINTAATSSSATRTSLLVLIIRITAGVCLLLTTATIYLQSCLDHILEVIQQLMDRFDQNPSHPNASDSCDSVAEFCPEHCCDIHDEESTVPTITSQSTTEPTSNVYRMPLSSSTSFGREPRVATERTPLMMDSGRDGHRDEDDEEQPQQVSNLEDQSPTTSHHQRRDNHCKVHKMPWVVHGTTAAILLLCGVVTFFRPHPEPIWMQGIPLLSVVIGNLFPAICYLRVVGRQPRISQGWVTFSWCLLLGSGVWIMVGLTQSIHPVLRQASVLVHVWILAES